MMVTYDARLVQEYAHRLHRSATQLVVTYAFGGAVTGGSLGFIVRDLQSTVLATMLVAVIGYFIGRDKALRLKLEAQLALCQMEIEQHLRRSTLVA